MYYMWDQKSSTQRGDQIRSPLIVTLAGHGWSTGAAPGQVPPSGNKGLIRPYFWKGGS